MAMQHSGMVIPDPITDTSLWQIGFYMVVKITPFTFLILALFSMQAKTKTECSPEQYIKNYALSVCLAKGYDSKDVKDDASVAARGYLEFGDYSLEAHTAVNNLADNFLAKNIPVNLAHQ